jgi:hypothetical protein
MTTKIKPITKDYITISAMALLPVNNSFLFSPLNNIKYKLKNRGIKN